MDDPRDPSPHAVARRLAQDAPRAPVTVAVVSWNTQDLLDRCLRSLADAHRSGLADVWVVDNGSADASVEMVRSRHPWVQLLASQTNLGYGGAINLVAAQTDSRWLAIANADVALHPGALEALRAAGEADTGAGIVAPRLVLPDGSTQHSVWSFPTIPATIAQNAGSRLVPARLGERLALRGRWDPDRARRVPWAEGAFLLIRRDAWDQAGGFDPDQWMSAEDLDLAWRLHRLRWATRYEPAAVLDHAESAATTQRWGQGLRVHWQRCAYSWMLRRRGRARTVLVGMINLAGSALRWLRVIVCRGDPLERQALGRWTRVHLYALAPARTLSRYR